jgi:hypothetical protein
VTEDAFPKALATVGNDAAKVEALLQARKK